MKQKKNGFFSKIKDHVYLGGSKIITSVLSIFFWLYLATIIEKIEYGEISYLISIAAVATAFAGIGTQQLIVVYGAKKENVFSPAYSLTLITSLVASIVVYFLIQDFLVSILIIGMTILNLTMAELNSQKQYRTFSIYAILRRVISIIAAISMFSIFGIKGVILGFFIGTLLGIHGSIKFLKIEKPSIKTLKPKFRFMMKSYATKITGMFFLWGDKIVIGSLFGFSTLGEYQIASQYLLFLSGISSMLMVYLLPQESQGKQNIKLKKYAVLLSFALVAISILIIPFIVNSILPKYQESIIPMQIMSVAIIPIVISVTFESHFIGRERNQWVLMGSGLQTGIFFALIVVLGYQFSLVGIAIGLVISTITRCVFNVIIFKTQFKIS